MGGWRKGKRIEAERTEEKRWTKTLKLKVGLAFMRCRSDRSRRHPSGPPAVTHISDDGEVGILPGLQEDDEQELAITVGASASEEMHQLAAAAAREAAVQQKEMQLRHSLILRMLEESERSRGGESGGGGAAVPARLCCRCMGRPKGTAFIPCRHTFCRLCARELWMGRGECPICQHQIHDILDIF